MTDLLYIGNESKKIKKELEDAFTNIKIEATYDEIHKERLLIELDDKQKENYLKYILKTGLGAISFYIQMAIRMPEKIDEIKTIMKKLNLI